MLKKIAAIFLGVFFGFIICEIVLQIYNPFPFSVKKGKLILPANQKKIFTNNWIKKLDKQINYSRNSLGFRGPESKDSLNKINSIISIGGSTTECKFLSDSSTWSFQLYQLLASQDSSIWVNNAGIDGHSTYGHILLLNEYIVKLKPRYAIFLTGINDVEIEEPDEFDVMTEKKISTKSVKSFIKSLLNYTETGRTIFNFYHVQLAYKKGLIHREVDLTQLIESKVEADIIQKRLDQQKKYTDGYRERLRKIKLMCNEAGIEPIFMTQPSLFGDYTDSLTGVMVGNKWLPNEQRNKNCALEGKILELYNDVVRTFSNGTIVIDLSKEMPKRSEYYYDFTHFTKEGATKISEIIFHHLSGIIKKKE